jgi:hypothetical protein
MQSPICVAKNHISSLYTDSAGCKTQARSENGRMDIWEGFWRMSGVGALIVKSTRGRKEQRLGLLDLSGKGQILSQFSCWQVKKMVELSLVAFSGQERVWWCCVLPIFSSFIPMNSFQVETEGTWRAQFPELLLQPLPEQVPRGMQGVFHLCVCPPSSLMGNLRPVLSAHL